MSRELSSFVEHNNGGIECKKQKFICNVVERKYMFKIQNFVSVNMKFTFKRGIVIRPDSKTSYSVHFEDYGC